MCWVVVHAVVPSPAAKPASSCYHVYMAVRIKPLCFCSIASLSLILLMFAPMRVHAQTLAVCPYAWTRDLKIGSTGDDVLVLQRYLNSDPATAVALFGAGSAGEETTRFGPLTKAAIVKFQDKYFNEILAPNNLTKGTGVVGPSTRATINSLCASVSASSQSQNPAQVAAAASAVPVDELTVSDPGQPEPSLAPANAAPLALTFTLTAGSKDVIVNEVTIERTGFGADGAFLSFGLWDEQGLQIGNVATLNSMHRAVFRRPFTVHAGASQTLEVYANMNADMTNFDGQRPIIQLVGINASSGVAGTLPLHGTPHTVNSSLVVGGADAILSQFDPGGARTRYINDTNVKFSGIRITAHSQEDIALSNIIWTQSGTVGPSDIENVVTVVDGKKYPTVISPYSEKEYVTFFDPEIAISKGNSIDVYVQGDIKVSAVNRTIEFDIRDINDEVSLSGSLYGLGVGLIPAANTDVTGSHSAFITSDGTTDGTTGTPFFAGSIVTVQGAAINVLQKN